MKKYLFKKAIATSYDNEWYRLILQAKQQGFSKSEIRTIINKLKDSHHMKKKI